MLFRAAKVHRRNRRRQENHAEKKTKARERQGRALTNFTETLPPPQSDLAQQVLKDPPYNFDFLTAPAP